MQAFLLAQVGKLAKQSPWTCSHCRETAYLTPVLCVRFLGTTASSRLDRKGGGRVCDSSPLSRTSANAVKKWLGVAMTTASRRKALATFEHRDKGVHSVVVMSPSFRATALYWGRKIALGGVKRLLATASPTQRNIAGWF